MNFLGFGQSAEIDIVFDGAENRKTAEVKCEDGKVEQMLLYYDGETVSGKVNVSLKKPGSKLEHQGIKIEFIGQIELFYDRGNHNEFKCIAKALARPGDLIQNTSYPFEFLNVEKPFEVYAGSNVRLRYFLRATIVRRISDITREVDIAVHTLSSYPDMNNPIKMEVGIEDCLHIEFEYNKSKYHLRDTIIGKIYFLLVRIKIKHMEIAIIKREATGTGPNMYTENETIAKFEIMDGAPVKGESIPIRVFLAGYILTPTMRDVNKKFSVKYFLNLVLMDTEDRRYFKQQEITLWRKADIPRYLHAQQQHQHAILQGQHLQHLPQHLQQQHQQQQQYLQQHQQVAQPQHLVGSSEGVGDPLLEQAGVPKMGLFTRESPNQEFSVTTSPTADITPHLSPDGAVDERGMGDGAVAAAANTSPAMLASTPPPLPIVAGASTASPNFLEESSTPSPTNAMLDSHRQDVAEDEPEEEVVDLQEDSLPDKLASSDKTTTTKTTTPLSAD